MSAAAEPPITSMATERYAMGVAAMDMVARTIAGEPPAEKVVDLGFPLCPRASTRPGKLERTEAGRGAGAGAKARKNASKEARGQTCTCPGHTPDSPLQATRRRPPHRKA